MFCSSAITKLPRIKKNGCIPVRKRQRKRDGVCVCEREREEK